MDYQEAAALVTRVAPDLSSFLHAYYPQFHRETNSSHQADDKHTEDLPSILEEISSTPQLQPITNNQLTTEANGQVEQGDINKSQNTLDCPPLLRITMPPDCLNSFKERMNKLVNFMVLRHISSRTLGIRQFSIWTKTTLHRSFQQLTICSNNYFKIQFSQEKGLLHTLAKHTASPWKEGGDTTFYTPSPLFFNTNHHVIKSNLKTSIWAQIWELLPFLKPKSSLKKP